MLAVYNVSPSSLAPRTRLILNRERQIGQVRAVRIAGLASQAQAGCEAGVTALYIARLVSRTRREICCVGALPGQQRRYWACGD